MSIPPASLESAETTARLDARVTEIVALHLHPDHGAPYWIRVAAKKELGATRFRSLSDLAQFGPMDAAALAQLPIEEFIPQCFIERRRECVIAETAERWAAPSSPSTATTNSTPRLCVRLSMRPGMWVFHAA